MTETTAPPAKPLERKLERRDDTRPRVPFREQVKSMRMLDDGREIVVDRRVIAFLTPLKEAPETGTVIAFKLAGAKPVVVRTPFAELKRRWPGPDGSNSKADRQDAPAAA